MSNMALEPTYENLIHHYLEDTIGRNDDLFYFVRILSGLSSGSAVALNAAWGSGKTFFVKQAKMLIDIHNPNSDIDIEFLNEEEIASIKKVYNKYNFGTEKYEMPKMTTVYYDAWKYDNTEDPLLSLLYCIITRYRENINPDKVSWMKGALLKSLPLFNGLAKSVTGLDIKEILEGLKNILETQEDWFKQIKKENDIEKQVREFLSNIIRNDEEKLIIFIDELDRCNPQYAVKLLERVKHYFNHPKVVFVISYNKAELQHSIKTLYGSEFSADKYLERFFDYEFGLSTIDVEKYMDILENSNIIHLNMCAIAKLYSFQMREVWKYNDCVNKAIAMFKKIISNNIYSSEKSLEFCIIWFLPVIIGLRFHNESSYRDFIDGKGFKHYKDFYDLQIKGYEPHFGELLSDGERFGKMRNGIILDGVSLQDRFEQLYTALLGDSTDSKSIRLGRILVNRELREEFRKICNGISYLADYK